MSKDNITSRFSVGMFSAVLVASLTLFGCGGETPGDVTVTSKISQAAPPAVTTTSPANGATGQALNASVSATFSVAMNNASLNAGSFTLRPSAGGPAVVGSISFAGNTATFTPATSLTGNTQYTATISATVTDAVGNTLAADYNWQFTTGSALDTSPPSVSATSPANNATGITLNSSVSATFSEAMNNATLNTSSFSLRPSAGGAALAGTVNVSGNTATFTPTANLAGSTQYTATITSAATDAAGNALTANYSWRFTTGAAPDTTPPTVSSTSPVNNATGITLNASVSATFSEAMNNATLNTSSFSLRPSAGGAAVTGTVNVSGNTATFTPTANLVGSTQYTATITSAATDAAGNALAANYNWQFTTGATPDTTPPTVSSSSPVNNATGVTLNASVSVTFSEAMNNATLNTASFTLQPFAGGATVSGTVSVSGNTATFTPTASLAGNTQYRAMISTAATDAAGNALSTNYNLLFTTGAALDTTAPTVISTSPPNGGTGVALNSTVSATFSEAMDNATLNTASFTLHRVTAGNPAVSGTVNVSGNTATFTPTSSLAGNTQYIATITTAATDAAGNALAADYTWTFTTALATPAGTANLAWDAVVNVNLSGYRVYYGTVSGSYVQPLGAGIAVGNVTTYSLTGLTSGTRYYFAVTAVDTSNNESAFSNEVFKDIP